MQYPLTNTAVLEHLSGIASEIGSVSVNASASGIENGSCSYSNSIRSGDDEQATTGTNRGDGMAI